MLRLTVLVSAAAGLAACAQPEPDNTASQPQTDRPPQTDEAEARASNEAPPPPQAALPDDAETIERAYLIGPWVARGGDCARPAFDISAVPGAQRPGIETSLHGAPRTGEVRTGADAAFVFDQPERTFALEKRRAEGLAVLPAKAGAVRLGGTQIEGAGAVFIKCSQPASDNDAKNGGAP